jgi:hypothetical protein
MAAVTVVLDGKPLLAYNSALEVNGRIVAPLHPFVTGIADRLWFEGNSLVIVRDGRTVRIPGVRRAPDAFDHAYIPLASILRALGVRVTYTPERHRVDISLREETVVATPEPFDPVAPTVAPRVVFTPTPQTTPRPVWSGSPLPRRTPLPFASPTTPRQ